MFKDNSSCSSSSKKIADDKKLTTKQFLSNTPVDYGNKIHKHFKIGHPCVIQNSDCFELLKKIPNGFVDLTITSPPYCMGKEYERSVNVKDFVEAHEKLFPEIYRVTSVGGSICWQVGYHAAKGTLVPLDYFVYQIASKFPDLHLRNRIIWTFGHGLHGSNRFSGRHEVVLWFTKGDKFKFELDRVRVPQKYPGKTSYKGENRGKPSSNPLGKNPGDVWEIPVVNANHVEKTVHPCQFPHALAQRLILALSDVGDTVFDPFVGSGTTAAAAIVEGRRFVGSELCEHYWKIAKTRALEAVRGSIKYRPHDKPLMIPDPNSTVAKKPNL